MLFYSWRHIYSMFLNMVCLFHLGAGKFTIYCSKMFVVDRTFAVAFSGTCLSADTHMNMHVDTQHQNYEVKVN